MCGIVGILNKNLRPKSASLFEMTKSIANRGPDDEGYLLYSNTHTTHYGDNSIQKKGKHIKTTFNQNFKVGFGFRQLKIIDLSNESHQPMSDFNQDYWIIFNGEIYNFKEIRTELSLLGYSFKSNSDTEVLLNAYKEWAYDMFSKLNGMFSFAILDIRKNEVLIARDRLGIKPLYYYNNEEHFVFASTSKAIIDSKLYKPEIHWEGLWQNFQFSIAQRPNTCFKGIHALEPAHYATYNLNTTIFTKFRYWEIPVNTQDHSISEKKATQIIEESLFKAVNYRLISDVEVGTFMSGGIDSTLISVMASKSNSNLKTLTLGFKDYKAYNEVNQASDTARLHKMNHIISEVHSNEILDNIDHIITAYEEPHFHLSANFILAKMASKNKLKVVLNGLGGDELFGGYDEYRKLKLWGRLKKNRSIIKLLPNIHQKIDKAKKIASYTDIASFYSHYYTNYFNKDLQKLFKTNPFDTTNTIKNLYNPNNLIFTDDFEALSFYNLKSYIGNHQMRAVDQSTMHFSIEGRFPLLDHQFIETAFKIPTKYKNKNGIQKSILKEVAKKYIAPSCLSMSKKGLGLPLEFWIKNELKELVHDSISSLKKRQLFNNEMIEQILNSKDEKKTWQLVATELWLQKFIYKT